MDPHFLAYAERHAPRYTSYPTAPHFSPAIGERLVRQWLGDLARDARISLYLHVPYCRQLCWYCGCNTYAARRDGPVLDYVNTLLAEIDLVAAATPACHVHEIHWGGGTPNILSAEQFSRIHSDLASRFELDTVIHHAIELDPRYVEREKADAYAEAGVNRVSLGVQDLNPRVQQAIGRVQPLELVHACVGILRDAGIDSINVDLMYGLPHQSVSDLRNSIRLTAAMRPNRIALFGYAHVPWFKKRQRLIPEGALPGPAERFDQAEAARLELQSLGYLAVGLDHFALASDELAIAARSGALRRSFQGYVADEADALIGLGPSAISTLPQGYAQNAAEPGAWAQAIAEGRVATSRGHALTPDDRKRRQVIEQIMCSFEADLTLLGGAAACKPELYTLGPMFADGLVGLVGDRLTLRGDAKPFCRLVALAFDTYATRGTAQHSRAV